MDKLDLPAWIEGQDRDILSEYIEGIPPSLICKKYGIETHTLSNLRLKYKIPAQRELRNKGLLVPSDSNTNDAADQSRDGRLEQAVQEYLSNPSEMSVVQLGKKYGVGAVAVSGEIKRRGYEVKRGRRPQKSDPNSPERPLSARDQAIVDAVIKQEKTLQEAADSQNPPISRERVRQILRRAGHQVGHRRDVIAKRYENKRYRHPKEKEIVALLREDRTPPKTIKQKYGVEMHYLNALRDRYKLPKGNRLNWRSDEVIQKEAEAIHAYYNRLDLTAAQISKDILKAKNPAAVTQLVKRRGLPRIRGKMLFGEDYVPNTKSRRKYSEEIKKRALDDYQDPTKSVTGIASEHGVDIQTINAWRIAADIPVIPRSRTTKS